MAFTLERQLKIINILCQAYVFLFSFLTFIILFNVTLPAISHGDHNTLYSLKIVTCFLFFNIWSNYVCVWYKSRLSVVKPGSFKSESAPSPLVLPQRIINPPQELAATSKLTAALPVDIYNNRYSYSARNSDYHLINKWTNNDLINEKDHASFNNYTDRVYYNQKWTVQKLNISNNNECKFDSYFTYSSNLDDDFSQQRLCKDEGSELAVSFDVIEEPPILAITGLFKCKDCNIAVPPRAKHCPLCRHCVLKRDHHCFFVGCCVGFHNQRFFITFCLYVGIGGIYSSVITLLYIRDNFEAAYTWGYLAYLFPVVLYIWLIGGTSSLTVGMIIFLYWSIVTALICVYYFIVQIFLVYRGQTNYEYLKGIKMYQANLWTNITSVFGKYWPIGFIIPAPFLGYSCNGINWHELISENKIF